jgi:hypothetical protein
MDTLDKGMIYVPGRMLPQYSIKYKIAEPVHNHQFPSSIPAQKKSIRILEVRLKKAIEERVASDLQMIWNFFLPSVWMKDFPPFSVLPPQLYPQPNQAMEAQNNHW